MPMTLDEIVDVIDDVARMSVFRLVISGGEPFLRQDIDEILLHAVRSHVGRVFVSTNGTCIEEDILTALSRYRQRLTFKVSVDGPAAFHDSWRGRAGALTLTLEAIRRLARSGFDVQVTTTLSRGNQPYLQDILDCVAASRCSRHYIVEIVPVGKAGADMVLSAEQRTAVHDLIWRERCRRSEGACEIVAKLAFARAGRAGFRCSGGTEECGVLADGSVVGCRLMPDLTEGNVRDVPLSKIWSDPDRFAAFRQITPAELKSPCNSCVRNQLCLGGCHAFARTAFGSFHSPDPRCLEGRDLMPLSLQGCRNVRTLDC